MSLGEGEKRKKRMNWRRRKEEEKLKRREKGYRRDQQGEQLIGSGQGERKKNRESGFTTNNSLFSLIDLKGGPS